VLCSFVEANANASAIVMIFNLAAGTLTSNSLEDVAEPIVKVTFNVTTSSASPLVTLATPFSITIVAPLTTSQT
jgi:hypothetical protein